MARAAVHLLAPAKRLVHQRAPGGERALDPRKQVAIEEAADHHDVPRRFRGGQLRPQRDHPGVDVHAVTPRQIARAFERVGVVVPDLRPPAVQREEDGLAAGPAGQVERTASRELGQAALEERRGPPQPRGRAVIGRAAVDRRERRVQPRHLAILHVRERLGCRPRLLRIVVHDEHGLRAGRELGPAGAELPGRHPSGALEVSGGERLRLARVEHAAARAPGRQLRGIDRPARHDVAPARGTRLGGGEDRTSAPSRRCARASSPDASAADRR